MPETRERSALEVLRRFNALVEERHLVVMGPQDLTDPLWDDIEAVLRATPTSDGGEVRERVVTELKRAAEVWQSPHEGDDNPLSDLLREAAALLSGSGTPQEEGEALRRFAEDIAEEAERYSAKGWQIDTRSVGVRARRALRSAPSGVEGEPVAYTAEIAGEPVLLWPAGAAVETGNPTLTPLYRAAPVPTREGEGAGYWWCPECREEVDSSRVTWQEIHDHCGTRVESRVTPASDGGEVRERVEEILSEWADLIGDSVESWGAALPPSPAEIADRILALLSGSGTPPGEGERGLIMRAMLETFPWSPDIRQGHFERAADAVIAALRSAPSGAEDRATPTDRSESDD